MTHVSSSTYVGLVFLLVGVVMNIVGVATPKWAFVEPILSSKVVATIGLWEYCELEAHEPHDSRLSLKCHTIKDDDFVKDDYDNYESKFKGARAMGTMSVIFGLIAIILDILLIIMFNKESTSNARAHMKISSVLLGVFSGFFSLTTVIIFGAGIYASLVSDTLYGSNSDIFIGYSYGICIPGFIFIFIGASVFDVGARRSMNPVAGAVFVTQAPQPVVVQTVGVPPQQYYGQPMMQAPQPVYSGASFSAMQPAYPGAPPAYK